MKKFFKVLLVVSILAMALLLTACGDNGDQGGYQAPDFVYVPTYFQVEGDVTSIDGAIYHDDVIYFRSYGMIGEKEPDPRDLAYNDGVVEDWMTEVYGTTLYRMNTDGTGLAKIEGFAPIQDDLGNTADLRSMTIDSTGNFWLVECLYVPEYDADFNYVDSTETFFLRKLDNNGNELFKAELTDVLETNEWGYIYVNSIAVDSNDHIYLTAEQNIYILDSEGKKLKKLSKENQWFDYLVTLSDGSVGVTLWEDGYMLQTIDTTSMDWGKSYPLPVNAYNIYTGGGNYELYSSDQSYLYGMNLKTGENETLLNWISADVNFNDVQSVIPLDDNRVLCSTYSWENENSQMELVMLTKTPYAEVPQKEVLTMATVSLGYELRSEIIKFNKTHPTHRIEVTDYSMYNTNDNYEAGMQKLNTEIIGGKIPDLLDMSNIPIKQYVAKGLLEDLYPYLDKDSTVGREDILDVVLRATENDGKLYQVVSSFAVSTMIGDARRLGDEKGWTFAEMLQLVQENPEATLLPTYHTRSDILNYFFMLNIDEYVDWNTGECKFNTDSFINMLEFCATLPEEYNWDEDEPWVDEYTMLSSGQILSLPISFYDLYEYRAYQTILEGNMVAKGYPTSDGHGTLIQFYSSLGMTTKCSNKDVAWEFLRNFYGKDYQEANANWQFPSNKALFDKKMEDAMKEPENNNSDIIGGGTAALSSDGNMVSYREYGRDYIYLSDGTEVEMKPMTQAELDYFMEMLNSADSYISRDASINAIINEEAAAFFSGQKSAADTAAVIQSRATIYVNEQR